jgi:YidC/Oxa1 family membrane protein insertase
MKSEHRSLLAIALSVGMIIIWYAVFRPAQPAPPPPAETPTVEEAQAKTEDIEKEAVALKIAEKEAVEAEPKTDPQAVLPEVETVIENDLIRAVFTNRGGVPKSWELKGYNEAAEKDSPLIDLAASEADMPPALALSFDSANFEFPDNPNYRLVSAGDSKIVYEWRSDEAVVTKTIKVADEQYTADVDVVVKNLTRTKLTGKPVVTVSGTTLPAKKSGFFSFLKQPPATNKSPVYYLDGKVRREKKVAKIPASQVMNPDPQSGGGLYWSGLEDRYFLSAIIPRALSSEVSAVMGSEPLESVGIGARALFAGAVLNEMNVLEGGAAEQNFTAYLGPKEINHLKAVGVRLDEAIDYGWFTVIALPILYLLKIFFSVVRNYGAAIILLTIFIKLLLHPINAKSMKSMKAMQQLQPKLKELQKKYKGDKQKLNMETMQLFRTHKVNPMGGCLPMVLQLPIYIALYKVLWNSIELYHAPFFWFYKDLSAPDPYMITPILLGVGMILQQKIMPSATADPAQKKMMMIMPVMFSVFMLFLPVGLVIYILVNTVMSVTQQWMYNKGIRMRDVLRLKFKTTAMVS